MPDLLIVAIAGLLAGAVNAVAGAGTLLSFPGLLATGLPPLTASITNTVGMVPGYIGSGLAYRTELRGTGRSLRPLAAAAAAGAVAGAGLLLVTPADVFESLVPFLVLGAAVVMAVQPLLVRWLATHRPMHAAGMAPLVASAICGLYGAYFGAALGVLLLATLGLLLPDGLQQLNAKKAVLSFVANAVGALLLATFADVAWAEAGVLAASALTGGLVGGRFARRLSVTALRGAVVAAAIGAAAYLFFT